jgi:hypothetical protein
MISVRLTTLECNDVKKTSGYTPIYRVPIIKGKNTKNSLLLISEKWSMYCNFKLPYAIRLNNHKEYAPPRTIPVAPKKAPVVFALNTPAKIKN